MTTFHAGSDEPFVGPGTVVLGSSIAMLVVAVILITVSSLGKAFRRHGANVKTGPLVIGTVVETEQTGLRINDQPQLEVTLQFTTVDGRQVTASDHKVIPLHQLALVQPGASLPLRYDPQNPEKIMIETSADQAALQQAYDAQRLASGEVTQESLYIARNGVRAQGVVLSTQPTGNIVGGCGEMLLHVRVAGSQHGDSYDTTVTKAIPQNVLHRVQPGSVIEVYYIPGNEQNITIAVPAS
ncbi:MAG: DUF3592 domain-containing protein [Micrococcales bacterium]|nr:DUF3592 domain-containing protein [Micrococcales bacterium]